VAGKAAVGVDDDLATGQAAVADRTADHEAPGRIDVVARAPIEPFLRQHRLDDLLHDRLAQLLMVEMSAVLGREHHRLDADRVCHSRSAA
jgi:hypothetical protein